MRNMIDSVPSLLFLALRQWGPMYAGSHYLVYVILLIMAYNGKPFSELNAALTPQGIKSGSLLTLVNRKAFPILAEETIES